MRRSLSSARRIGPALAVVSLFACGNEQGRTVAATESPTRVRIARLPSDDYWSAETRARAIADGVAVIRKHECTRCHVIDGLRTAGNKRTRRARDCVSCHVFIKGLAPGQPLYERIAKNNGKDVLDRYIRNIAHLMRVPDLTRIGRRIRPAWIARYLQAPFDLRPNMAESMYRNKLTKREARAIARYLAARADVRDPFAAGPAAVAVPSRPSAQRLARGKTLFVAKGCAGCHTFGNVRFGVTRTALLAARDQSLLAPNLRFAKDRMDPDTMVRWILNPKGVQATATMPSLGVTWEEAAVLRDYLWYAEPSLAPAPTDAVKQALMSLPPAATHPVDWAEVKDKVLGAVCVHCHMNDYEKDTGPGNTGGFGYKGMGLSFRTYRRIVWGAVDNLTGKRYSVLVPRKGEKLPRLLQVLLLRRVENLRDMRGPFADHRFPAFPTGTLGMPMGLPALSDEQIGIVRAWIEQGCRGRRDVTGRPGFDDGFLVADGPIKQNKGCDLREPEMPPPSWTVEAYQKTHASRAGDASAGN